jgi:hypothetical protein
MVTKRECDACGKTYEAHRVTSKFCSPKCRIANHEKSKRPSAALSAEPVDEGPVFAKSRAKLEAAGRLDTWEGAVALQLAARLDAQVREGGMGVAAIVREHRASMEEALKGASVAADPLDELRERRDRRRAG